MNRKLKLENIYQKKKKLDKKKLVVQCPGLWNPFISHSKCGDSIWKFKSEPVNNLLQAKDIL